MNNLLDWTGKPANGHHTDEKNQEEMSIYSRKVPETSFFNNGSRSFRQSVPETNELNS